MNVVSHTSTCLSETARKQLVTLNYLRRSEHSVSLCHHASGSWNSFENFGVLGAGLVEGSMALGGSFLWGFGFSHQVDLFCDAASTVDKFCGKYSTTPVANSRRSAFIKSDAYLHLCICLFRLDVFHRVARNTDL